MKYSHQWTRKFYVEEGFGATLQDYNRFLVYLAEISAYSENKSISSLVEQKIKEVPKKGLQSDNIGRGVLEKLELPGFRGEQIRRWIFSRKTADFMAMTDLPLSLRRELAEKFDIFCGTVVTRQKPDDASSNDPKVFPQISLR
ncbi:MAG: hypothetical protein LBT05_06160 [Planctomycetaceae bacterium]|jgi:hypothetical protein|nr:hypothetical protein [Planctomycetaceae bacterium]